MSEDTVAYATLNPLNTIAGLERRKRALTVDIQTEKQRHKEKLEGLTHEYRETDERVQFMSRGIDEAKVLLATHVIYVHGTYNRAGEDRYSVIEDAITDILAGAKKLRTEAFGTKDYAHWHGQRSDHSYGCGPRHGSTIFQVGLHRPVREHNKVLTEDEIDAVVYYLRNLERIQAAEQDARAASGAVA